MLQNVTSGADSFLFPGKLLPVHGSLELFGPVIVGKRPLHFTEAGMMMPCAPITDCSGEQDMKHFMIEHKFKKIARDAGVVQQPADDDPVLVGTVPAQTTIRPAVAPVDRLYRDLSIKKLIVELMENLPQIGY